jgi:hypothetical protein
MRLALGVASAALLVAGAIAVSFLDTDLEEVQASA